MAKQFQWRRGTTAQHDSFTGAEGEVTVDTDKETLVVHDGSTAGGFPMVRNGGDIDVGIGTASPDNKLHVYDSTIQVGAKTGDTSVGIGDGTAIRIAGIPDQSTEWGAIQWYREFSDVVGAEVIADRPSTAEADTDLIFKTGTSSVSEAMRIDSAGQITLAKQPAFQAIATTQIEATGDGTLVTVQFDIEIFDRGSNFDSVTNFNFIAPVTGLYLLSVTGLFTGNIAGDWTASHRSARITLVTSNRTYILALINPDNTKESLGANGTLILSGCVVADMNAGDTAHVVAAVDGDTKVIDVGGIQFSGFLVA